MAAQNLEKRAERFTQGTIEIAFPDQGTIGTILKTFRHGETFFSEADCVEQGDLVGRLAQLDTAVTPAHRLEQSAFHQGLDQLEQEQLGNAIGARNLGNPAEPRLVHGAIDQRANGVIGLAGQSHEHFP